MTVGAQQDALGDLLANVINRSGEAPLGDPERLLSRIEVVKLKGAGTAVIAAQDTLPAGLLDKNLLDLSPPAGNSLGSALLTSWVPSIADQRELGLAMSATVPDNRSPALADRLLDVLAPSVRWAVQPMTRDPITSRGLAAINLIGDLGKREPPVNERFEVLPGQTAARCVLLTAVGDQPVLAYPIAHGRRISTHQRSDFGQRSALFQPGLE